MIDIHRETDYSSGLFVLRVACDWFITGNNNNNNNNNNFIYPNKLQEREYI